MKRLFTPVTINKLVIPNRIVMPAFGLKYTGLDRKPNSRLIDFYEARARGGCGLIIVGGVGIDMVGGGMMMPGIDSDDFIEPWSRMAEAVHRHGSRLFLQLFHAGRYQHSVMARGQQAVAPSPVPSRYTKETPRELSIEEVREVEEKFAAAAARAKAAGADGVEVIASAGYLVCQFLSPLTNQRTDEYGGSFENRCRFGVNVLRRIRERVGSDYPVTIRISGSEFMPGGNTSTDMLEVCRAFEAAGADAFNVTGGWHETTVPQLPTLVPRGAFSYLATRIRRVVSVPVFASNRIVAPDQAEELLQESVCDLVCVGRAQIADPEWAVKAKEGREREIRPCLGCLQGCLERLFRVRDVQCLCNPQAGFESERRLEAAATPRRVVVIGAGPAGLEAALTAHKRGHHVHLLERQPTIGGQLPLAAAPPGRGEFLTLLRYYEAEVERTALPMTLGHPATREKLAELAPDVIIQATGSSQLLPELPGINLPHVVTAWDVLLKRATVGDRVVVLGGGAVGIETAIAVAEQGTISGETLKFLLKHEAEDIETLRELATRGTRNVTIVEMLPKLGKGIGPANKWVFLKELQLLGVRTEIGARVTEITPDAVRCEQDGRSLEVPADSVVVALGARPNQELDDLVEGLGAEVVRVGDCKQSRTILEAIHEGFLAARRII